MLGNGGGTGQASGPSAGQGQGPSAVQGQGQAAIGNDGGQGQALGQGVFGNDGGVGQASAQGQGIFSNDGGLGQASGQGAFGNDMGLGQSTTGGHGIFGNDAGLGQASGPLGTDGGLGQTVSGGHGVIGNLPPIASNIGDPSFIPLIVGIGTAAAASGAYATAATSSRPSSSRPSTGSSSQPGPLVTIAKPHGGYPPALQNWNASHGFGQAQAGPSTSSNNNSNRGDGPGPSTNLPYDSRASTPSVYSHASYIGNSSTPYNGGDSSSGAPSLPSMGAIHSSNQQQKHPHRPFGRVPSLQVTNNTDYDYQPYTEIGSSSLSMGSGPSQQAPSYDGKGRPLNMPPEKAPLVHLDGGLYEEPPSSGPRTANAPPAYIE
ncbi:hypothetical protein BYT27DRAFT_6529697 [Phlegmacium glaucopus]|nr:hypothetical protein BYT27DRAFT_6529697 [Phlegmacium glaucopus]